MKIRSIIVIAVLSLLGIFLLGLSFVERMQREEMARLNQYEEALKKESVPLKFMILSRVNGNIAVRFRFYDVDAREIGNFENSWQGNELAVDVISVPYRGGFLPFPRIVFTDMMAPEDGTDLCAYYDNAGFPGIFPESDSKTIRNELMVIFAQVMEYDTLPEGTFGNAVHDIARLAAFETGIVYKLVTRSKGGIEIMEDENHAP